MTESRFDTAVKTAWGRFETQLGTLLAALGDGSLVIDVEAETTGQGSSPYLQFAGDGGWIRGEVSANKYLDRACRLDGVQKKSLRALGWQRPDGEHPNWWVEVERAQFQVLHTMSMGALRQVLGVQHPQFLSWDDDVESESEVDDGFEHEFGLPDCAEELRAMVETTVRLQLGQDVIETDDDGDIPICARKIPLWVRVLDDSPTVRIFSHVVVGVLSSRQARIEADILNRRYRLLKFAVQDRRIVASIDLPAAPFVAQHLRDMLDLADAVLNDLADDLVLRTGGRLFFKPNSPGPRRSA